MSGTNMPPDLSTAQDRLDFANVVEGGYPTSPVVARTVPLLLACPLPMPASVVFLLRLPDRSTFAQGAALVQGRLAAGKSAWPGYADTM